MKKTLTINLNQSVFNIDEDAYQILSTYLASLEKHFQKEEGSQEIISDIESRIAEKFISKVTKSKNVIVLSDVNTVISQIGTLKDIASQDETILNQPTTTTFIDDINSFFESFKHKKIYRNTDNKVLAGVIGGIGEYFNVDPIILRLAYLLITIFGAVAPGVIVYLFAALIVPKPPVVSA